MFLRVSPEDPSAPRERFCPFVLTENSPFYTPLLYCMLLAAMKGHARKGEFIRVAENLYRYSSSQTYYAVFRRNGRLKWQGLRTTDRDLAKRRLKDALTGAARVDVRHEQMTLGALLDLYADHLNQFDVRTRANRR